MRIAQIIGKVTLNRHIPEMAAARLRIAVPMTLTDLTQRGEPQSDPLVIWDELAPAKAI